MNNFKRRDFLKSSTLFAGATLFSPYLLSCQNPNNKLNIAVIGVGGRGKAFKKFGLHHPDDEENKKAEK